MVFLQFNSSASCDLETNNRRHLNIQVWRNIIHASFSRGSNTQFAVNIRWKISYQMQFHNMKVQEYATNLLNLSPHCVDGKKYTDWRHTGQSHVDTNLTMMICICSRCFGFWIGRESVRWWFWALVRNTSRAEGQRDRWRRQPAGRRKKDIGCESGGNMKEITQIWRGEAVETLTGTGAPSGTSPRASGVVARVMWCVEGGSSHERVTRGDEGGCTTAASFVPEGTGGPHVSAHAVRNGFHVSWQRCCEERSFLYIPQDGRLPVGQWCSKEANPLRANQTSTWWVLLGSRMWSSF